MNDEHEKSLEACFEAFFMFIIHSSIQVVQCSFVIVVERAVIAITDTGKHPRTGIGARRCAGNMDGANSARAFVHWRPAATERPVHVIRVAEADAMPEFMGEDTGQRVVVPILVLLVEFHLRVRIAAAGKARRSDVATAVDDFDVDIAAAATSNVIEIELQVFRIVADDGILNGRNHIGISVSAVADSDGTRRRDQIGRVILLGFRNAQRMSDGEIANLLAGQNDVAFHEVALLDDLDVFVAEAHVSDFLQNILRDSLLGEFGAVFRTA